ncbi:MAG: diaminopimelate epimerase [Acidimicrobiales bacterium]
MHLTKHHGLGNDFLVLTDPTGTRPLTPQLAQAACDRRRGIGADGLLRLSPGTHGTQVSMQLRNADGSAAEMSGNGIACLVQAALLTGLAQGPEVTVSSEAGRRSVVSTPGSSPTSHVMTVDMGDAKVGDDEPAWIRGPVRRAARVDIGNPHLVLHLDDLDAVDLDALGVEVNESVPGGSNVELLTLGPGEAELTMRVYERGVGRTEACGTGACAVAAAAEDWGLAPAAVRVHQPGGAVTIDVGAPTHMTVTVVHVATIEWHQ